MPSTTLFSVLSVEAVAAVVGRVLVEKRFNTGCFMDAVTATSSMLPAAPHEERQNNRHTLVRVPIKVCNLLERYIDIAEHTTTPGSRHCKYCFSVLTTQRTFTEHINRCHTKDVLFLCNDGECNYQSFSFLSFCNHDRRYHNSRRNLSVGFRRSEILQSQPTVYEVVTPSRDLAGRCQWVWEDKPCGFSPDDGQTGANNSPPVYHLQRPENISCTPLSPLPDQGAQSTDSASSGDEEDQAWENNGAFPAQEQRSGNIGSPPSEQGADEACPAFEPTDDFRDIYHFFKQKLEALQLDLNLNG